MKRIALLTMLVACSLGAGAQEMTPEEEALTKKELNELKKNENVVCAEIVEYMADDSEKTITLSQQKSMQLLQAHVIEIFAKRLKMDKADVQEIMDVIDDKCQNVEIRKGDLLRVFTYIMIDAAKLKSGKVSQKDWDKYFGKPEPVAVKNSTTAQEATVQLPADTLPATPTPLPGETVAVAEASKDTTATTVAPNPETPKPASEETAAQPATPAVAVPVTPVPTPSTPQPEKKEAAPEVKVPELCKTLLAQKDMPTLLKHLDSEKAYERLIYGSERSMRRAADCYIVIVDKATKKIVTVLDKGAAERMNFVTKQMDNFNNYRGGGKYSAIFVQSLK